MTTFRNPADVEIAAQQLHIVTPHPAAERELLNSTKLPVTNCSMLLKLLQHLRLPDGVSRAAFAEAFLPGRMIVLQCIDDLALKPYGNTEEEIVDSIAQSSNTYKTRKTAT